VRKLAAGAVLLLGAAAGARALTGRSSKRQRVDVYYEDGAMVSLPGNAPESEPVLARAREALHVVGQA
jgi:hypothetical protein